jgi:hypothetical protein
MSGRMMFLRIPRCRFFHGIFSEGHAAFKKNSLFEQWCLIVFAIVEFAVKRYVAMMGAEKVRSNFFW